MKEYEAAVFSKEKYLLAESPFYDERTGLLSFVDIVNGKFYTMDPEHRLSCFDAGQQIGAAVPMKQPGCYVLCGVDGLYYFDGETAEKRIDLCEYFEPYQRCNDAKADSSGRLFFGSTVYQEGYKANGNLYCYDHGEIKILQRDTKISNGMAWSKDQKNFFFSDSLEHAVFRYDYDKETGIISNRKILFGVEDGVPDGMCIDAQDRIWVAFWGGGRIECHDPDNGELLARVSVSAKNVTSCCFFGEDRDELFITTAGDHLDGEYDGCLFTCKVDAQGSSSDRVHME